MQSFYELVYFITVARVGGFRLIGALLILRICLKWLRNLAALARSFLLLLIRRRLLRFWTPRAALCRLSGLLVVWFKVPVLLGGWVLLFRSPFMGAFPHSLRSLHALRSRMAGVTRLLKRSTQANLITLAYASSICELFLAGAAVLANAKQMFGKSDANVKQTQKCTHM